MPLRDGPLRVFFVTDIVQCVPNKLDGKSPVAPCETCLKVRRDSKKTIHYIPCLRFKVTSMAVYRPGGLDLTKRFDHTKVMDIADYSDNLTYEINITQGLCRWPIPLRVRRFKPRKTDVTYRRFMDGGAPRFHDTGAFCLADVEKTARQFGEYIECNAFEGLEEAVHGSDDIVKDVFAMIATHYNSLPVSFPFPIPIFCTC